MCWWCRSCHICILLCVDQPWTQQVMGFSNHGLTSKWPKLAELLPPSHPLCFVLATSPSFLGHLTFIFALLRVPSCPLWWTAQNANTNAWSLKVLPHTSWLDEELSLLQLYANTHLLNAFGILVIVNHTTTANSQGQACYVSKSI